MIVVESKTYRVKQPVFEALHEAAKKDGAIPASHLAGAAVRNLIRRMRRRGNWDLVVEYKKAREWSGASGQLTVQLSGVEIELLETIESAIGVKIAVIIEAAVVIYLKDLDAGSAEG